mgnify:CR=1 FL=1|tara:strand:+ start:501 stop:680 length:180 start_codon:yes stop_codon:yes gene_type:complete
MNDKGIQAVHTAAFVERIIENHKEEVNALTGKILSQQRRIMDLEKTLRQVNARLNNIMD